MRGVEAVVFSYKTIALLGSQAALDEIEVIVFVFAVNFVADDGMAEVREVDADLMFSAGDENHAQQSKAAISATEGVKGEDLRRCRQAVGSDTIFDGDAAVRVGAERRLDEARAIEFTVNDREVLLVDRTSFPEFAQAHPSLELFGDDNDAACFAIETIDEMSLRVSQVEANAADQAGVNVSFGRVTDKSGGFVDDEEIFVFGDDIKKMFHRGYFSSWSAGLTPFFAPLKPYMVGL